jgi:micrococcal nuclease
MLLRLPLPLTKGNFLMTLPLTLRLLRPLQQFFATLLFVVVCYSPALGDIPKSAEAARVIQVIDGDTIIVELQKRREHLRLIGIDTPETRPNHRAELQAHDRHMDQKTIFQLGNRASNYTRELLPKNSTVFLEFDVDKRDRYQRLLAYVWVRPANASTGLMANEALLKAGYAYLLTVPPNVKYRRRLADAFAEGRREKRGLWQR